MGNKATHHARRQELRRRLRARGVPEPEIERQVAQLGARQSAARRAGIGTVAQLEAHWDETHARLSPNDSKHKPAYVDPLERGPARVTPATAKAARRHKATTRYEYDQETRT